MDKVKDLNKKTDDSAYWTMGMFYFNKNDSRIFPPKKSGGGWTMNFANPKSISALIVILASIFFFVAVVSSQPGFKSHRYDKGGVKKNYTDPPVATPDGFFKD